MSGETQGQAATVSHLYDTRRTIVARQETAVVLQPVGKISRGVASTIDWEVSLGLVDATFLEEGSWGRLNPLAGGQQVTALVVMPSMTAARMVIRPRR